MKTYSLQGDWQVRLQDDTRWSMKLPGTLDESAIGYPDVAKAELHPDLAPWDSGEKQPDAPIATRFTRKHTYEGPAWIEKSVTFPQAQDKRLFLDVERARCLRLMVDGEEISPWEEQTLSTPHHFEVTRFAGGKHSITFVSDNSYPGLPREAILYSSAATDETQTNWNGLLGYVRLREEEAVFVSRIRVYPLGETLNVKIQLDAALPYTGTLSLRSQALAEPVEKPVSLDAGRTELALDGLPLQKGILRWDEEEGNLWTLSVALSNGEEKTATFGIRTFGDNGRGRLALNGRTIFLRGEANCAVFPQTGYCPMTQQEWTDILKTYRSYGVNCMRFHSHCPPEAAFAAADQLGMLMQPELSHWNPRDAFLSSESMEYYTAELRQILLMLANHPSFVMLSLGNELCTDEKGRERMDQLMRMAREIDPTRLYTRGSNDHYGTVGCGEQTDFYTSQKYYSHVLRGTFAASPKVPGGIQGYLNRSYPSAKTDYSETMVQLRRQYRKPVFSFEVGQFEVLPDFREIEAFQGVTDPVNYRLIAQRVSEKGLQPDWERYVQASGELSRLCYREEIEAAMRTKELSGISLLGLQDFPGQGTALVGMLNAHLQPKPYPFAAPEKFHAFFRDQLPLVKLERYTYETGETLRAQVEIANYGKSPVGGLLEYSLEGGGKVLHGTLGEVLCPMGENTPVGTLSILLEDFPAPCALQLRVWVGEVHTSYPVWVYPAQTPICPPNVHETRHLDEVALSVLRGGGCVYLSPDSTKEQLPHSIQAQFSTDFWSVGTFPAQEGAMGQLIEENHPLFADFPTSFHTDWQWWPMAVQRAIVLPQRMQCIITEMDSYAFLRPMAQLLECHCEGGRLLISSLGLHQLQQYPEARALQRSIYRYLASPTFDSHNHLSAEAVRELVV